MIQAEVICDSISQEGIRLTTFKLRYPKFIHGEAKTHRVLRLGNEGGYFVSEQEVGFMDDPNISRNASSSRAVPTKRLLQEVRDDALRAAPVFWGKNQKGMQAVEEFTDHDLRIVQMLWKNAALAAADYAELMDTRGVHKQIVNRVLEPFTHINVVATATEWTNFFGLRLHKDAQPEMRELAIQMWRARVESKPKELQLGEWHLPFILPEEWAEVNGGSWSLERAIKVSVARCARVSYEDFETGKVSDWHKDLELYYRLLAGLNDPTQPLHCSPAEHQASPDMQHPTRGGWMHLNEHGNLHGWCQYRKRLIGEACAPIPAEFK